MDKKLVITVAAFALPLVALAVLTQVASPTPKAADKVAPVADGASDIKMAKEAHNKKNKHTTDRLAVLEKMNQADWDAEGIRVGEAAKNRAPSLEKALENNRAALERFKKKTPEEYAQDLKRDQESKKKREAQAAAPATAPKMSFPPAKN